jgi:hypothetical protein
METFWKDFVPDRKDEEPEGWTDEDQEELDDYNQSLEDQAMEED